MTPQEFSTKVKAKYPSYANMDDVELSNKIIAKYPQYKSQVNFETPVATLPERIKADISQAGKKVYEILETGGAHAGETPLRRGVEATAEAFKTPLKVAAEFLPETAKKGLEFVGGKMGGAIDWLGEKLGSTESAQRFVSEYPEAAKALEEAANIGKGTGEIASSILVTGGIARGLQKTVDVTSKGINFVAGIPKTVRTQMGKTIDNWKGYSSNKAKLSITKDVDSLLKATKGISGKAQLAGKKGTDLQSTLSDPEVFRGLKVQNAKIVPDEAIKVIQKRIDKVLDAKQQMLPKIDTLVPETPREVILNKAIEDIRGKYTPADEAGIITAIEKQVSALPATMKPSFIDSLRARFRQSARNAQGIQKSSSEYAALENAARNTVFDITDKLPVTGAAEYAALNDYVRNMINTTEFLDKTLRNQIVKGGRLKGYSMRIVGTVAGAAKGPIGAILGGEMGGAIADIITNNQLGSSMKMLLIKGMTNDPAIIAQAMELLKNIKDLNVPLLPAHIKGTPRSVSIGTETISLPAKSQGELDILYGGKKTLTSRYPAVRPAHQIALEQAANAKNWTKVKEIIQTIPKDDPYRSSMESLFKGKI